MDYQTPHQLLSTQTFTPMASFNQPDYRLIGTSSTQPTQQNYEGMGTQLNLDDFTDLCLSTWTYVREVLQTPTQSTTVFYETPQIDPQRGIRDIRPRRCGTSVHLI